MVYGPIAAYLVEAFPGEDPLHGAVAAVPHRQRRLRRPAAADRPLRRREHGQHLRRSVLPDRRRAAHVRRRIAAAEGNAQRADLGGSGKAMTSESTPGLVWKKLESNRENESWFHAEWEIHRTKVPGGWLVLTRLGGSAPQGITFYPTPTIAGTAGARRRNERIATDSFGHSMRLPRRIWRRSRVAAGCALLAMALWAFWIEPARPSRKRTSQCSFVTIGIHANCDSHRPSRRLAIQRHLQASRNRQPHQRRSSGRNLPSRRPGDPGRRRRTLRCAGGHRGGTAASSRDSGPLRCARQPRRLARSRPRAKRHRGNGIQVLEETAARVENPAGPLWIAGISDLWTGRTPLQLPYPQ